MQGSLSSLLVLGLSRNNQTKEAKDEKDPRNPKKEG
jgi:hypothetical protein